MKYFKILIIPIFLIVILSISCERDDICPESTPTTPSLIIDAFDFENQEDSKNVFGLAVAGVDRSDILPGYGIVSIAKIVLPLKTNENSTEYILIKEAFINNAGTPDDADDDFIDGNQDQIRINYSRKEVFVSKACGYKTIFENLTLTVVPDGDNWILSSTPLTPNQSVEDETTAHFNIFH